MTRVSESLEKPGRLAKITLTLSVAVLLIAGGLTLWIRQGPSVVTVDDAVSEFRKSTPSASADGDVPAADQRIDTAVTVPPGEGTPATGPPTRQAQGPNAKAPSPPPSVQAAAPRHLSAPPEAGVYEYRTTGYGETDALGGARQDYPESVPVVVQHGGCGFTVRWQPLRERWDEWEFCAPPGGRQMVRITTFHEFYQQKLRQDFACGRTEAVASFDPGFKWGWSCESSSSKITATATMVGITSVDVGGRPVDAFYIHHEATFTGGNEGSQTFEWWLHSSTGLPLKMVRSVRTMSDSPFGRVKYYEEATSMIVSLKPKR